jgi:hypothetical protein
MPPWRSIRYQTTLECTPAWLSSRTAQNLTRMEGAEKKWPVDTTNKNMAHKRACRIVTILVNLKHSLERRTDVYAHSELQSKLPRHIEQTTSRVAPANQDCNIKHSTHLILAKLGPLRLESGVEPVNRCFVLLKYFQHQVRTEKNQKKWPVDTTDKNMAHKMPPRVHNPRIPDQSPVWRRLVQRSCKYAR